MSLLVFCVICVISIHIQTAGGYMDADRQKHNTLDKTNGPKPVPTLSYNYQPTKVRERHHARGKWERRQGSYYVSPPKVEVPFVSKPSVVDTIASMERRNSIPTTGVFKTYGKGQVKIPYKGATVHVPKTFGSNRAHRAMISTRVFDPPKNPDFDANDVFSRSRRDCAGCPKDEMVVASRGHNYVILPDPCSHKYPNSIIFPGFSAEQEKEWNGEGISGGTYEASKYFEWKTISGPKPGVKLTEGIHYITGSMGNRKHICQYKYQVEVRKCPPIHRNNINVTCNAENAWGSECSFSCHPKYELKGNSKTECGDEFNWMDTIPKCVANFNCLLPELEDGTKLNCETNELSEEMSNEYLPEGAYCRLKNKGSETAMKCRKGEWKIVHNKRKNRRHVQHNNKLKESEGKLCKPDSC